jgi:hypothetical protein
MSRTALTVTAVAVLLGVLLDGVIGYSPFPGYAAIIGLGGCVVIVLVSKWLGTTLLERPEGYYPQDTDPDVQADLHG